MISSTCYHSDNKQDECLCVKLTKTLHFCGPCLECKSSQNIKVGLYKKKKEEIDGKYNTTAGSSHVASVDNPEPDVIPAVAENDGAHAYQQRPDFNGKKC